MNWIIFASTSVVFFTALNLLQRKIAIDSKYPRAASLVFNIYGATFALVIFVLTKSYREINLPKELAPWVFMGIACIAYAVFERGRFVAAKLLEASVLSIVSSFEVVIAFTAAALLYQETISPQKFIGAGFIFLALLIVSWGNKAKNKISLKGVLVALTIFTFLAIAWTLDKKGALYFSPNVYQLFIWSIPVLFIYLPYIKRHEIAYEIKIGSWKVILLAFTNVIGYFLQLKAFSLTDATNVIPVVQTSLLFTVILGIFLLGERDFMLKKIFATILSLIGAYILIVS